jgi:hypothetical protein
MGEVRMSVMVVSVARAYIEPAAEADIVSPESVVNGESISRSEHGTTQFGK